MIVICCQVQTKGLGRVLGAFSFPGFVVFEAHPHQLLPEGIPMSRSPFYRIAMFAIAACLAACTFARERFVEPVLAVARAVKGLVLDGFALAARTDGDGFARPAVLFVQARAFVLRLAKRERPQLSGSWRMCPST